MTFGIYKQGQGHWTRLMTLLGGMVLFFWGAAWLAGQVTKIDLPKEADGVTYIVDPRFVQGGAGIVVIAIGAVVSYWLAYSKPAAGEFFIATEAEMKKVNWSSRREVLGSTWVVIGISVILASSLFVVDIGFSKLFQFIKVLQSSN